MVVVSVCGFGMSGIAKVGGKRLVLVIRVRGERRELGWACFGIR